LDTLFSWIALEDTLTLELGPETTLEIEGGGLDLSAVSEDQDNLVLKAHRALEAKTGRSLDTRFHLRKNIPVGGGLGGGSADAAAALVGLNELHELGLSPAELLEVARPLGADVAFGLVGGVARGTRYGDVLQSVPFPETLRNWKLVLVFPKFGCSTPQVYKLWDQDPSLEARGSTERFLTVEDSRAKLALVANDLEKPAFRLYPELAILKESMRSLGLSGSGSTLFGFLPPEGEIEPVRQGLTSFSVSVKETRLKETTRFELVS
jgi:4-diphosphocytidyl-2-C-methyl-D-erythritol kinase